MEESRGMAGRYMYLVGTPCCPMHGGRTSCLPRISRGSVDPGGSFPFRPASGVPPRLSSFSPSPPALLHDNLGL